MIKWTNFTPKPVRCINNVVEIVKDSHMVLSITEGKAYMVTASDETDQFYQIRDDRGIISAYAQDRFVTLPTCKICGDTISITYHDELNQYLADNLLCFTCYHWEDVAKQRDEHPDEFFVMNGRVYHDGGDKPSMGGRGHGGATFYIICDDGLKAKSSNLWDRGEVPVAWKNKFPDDARQVSYDEWVQS